MMEDGSLKSAFEKHWLAKLCKKQNSKLKTRNSEPLFVSVGTVFPQKGFDRFKGAKKLLEEKVILIELKRLLVMVMILKIKNLKQNWE